MEQEKIINYNPPTKKGLSLKDLKKILFKWQKKLGLNDWTLDLKIVDFKRKNDFRQSGDFEADSEKKIATILLTWDPWRGDEEYVLLHELLHVVVYDYDKYSEDLILKNFEKFGPEHGTYMDKLEDLVHYLTRTFLGRSDR